MEVIEFVGTQLKNCYLFFMRQWWLAVLLVVPLIQFVILLITNLYGRKE